MTIVAPSTAQINERTAQRVAALSISSVVADQIARLKSNLCYDGLTEIEYIQIAALRAADGKLSRIVGDIMRHAFR